MDGKCVMQQFLLLPHMVALESGGNAGAWVAAGVEDVAAVMVNGLVEEGLEARLDVAPCTGVERFFLAPDDVLCVGVIVKILLDLLPWEWVKLFNTGDGGVLETIRLTVLGQGGVDLARAEDDTIDLFGLVDGLAVLGFGDDPLEVRISGEVLKW